MEYLLALWGTHGWWIMMVPAGGALVVLFLLAEIFQLAIQGRRWWVAVLAFFLTIVVSAGIGYPLWLAGVQPIWAVWIPLVSLGAMFVVALLAEVHILRRWFGRWLGPRWPRTGRVVSHMLNVRETPDPDANVIQRLNRGEQVQVIAQTDDGNWYQIGDTEWVSARYIQL